MYLQVANKGACNIIHLDIFRLLNTLRDILCTFQHVLDSETCVEIHVYMYFQILLSHPEHGIVGMDAGHLQP